MSICDLIRRKFGADLDPLVNVAPAQLDEARRTLALWSEASRSDLRRLASAIRKGREGMPQWKLQLVARVLAKRALGPESDSVRKTVLVALAAADPDFDAVAAVL